HRAASDVTGTRGCSALAAVGGCRLAAAVGRSRAAARGEHCLAEAARGVPALEGGAVDLDVRGAAAGLLAVRIGDLADPRLVGLGVDIGLDLLGGAGLLGEGPQLLVAQTLGALGGLVGEDQLLE